MVSSAKENTRPRSGDQPYKRRNLNDENVRQFNITSWSHLTNSFNIVQILKPSVLQESQTSAAVCRIRDNAASPSIPRRAFRAAPIPELSDEPFTSAGPTFASPIQLHEFQSKVVPVQSADLPLVPRLSLDYDDPPRSRATTCSPMAISPGYSPTRFIFSTSLRGPDTPIQDSPSPARLVCLPVAECVQPLLDARQPSSRVDHWHAGSISSTGSFHMDISSPTTQCTPSVFSGRPDLACPRSDPQHVHPRLCPSDSSLKDVSESLLLKSTSECQIVAGQSTFWPGKTVTFTYKQKRSARPTVGLQLV